MREIKFRAFDKTSNQMFYSSDASQFDENSGREYFPFVFEIGYKGHRDLELMQYTGLKDKNGKEIYECDILQHPENPIRRLTVRFGDGMFEVFRKGNEDDPSPLYTMNHFLVVGNIKENPELLNRELKQ